MKLLFTFILSCCFLSIANAQILQKLSLGVQGGRCTPKNIYVEGALANNFVQIPTKAWSKGIFLQYDLSDNFYSRVTFKKAAIDLENLHKYYSNGILLDKGAFGIRFDNKQYELSAGYRGKITKRLNFTGSLGATYLDFERGTVAPQAAGLTATDSTFGYSISISSDLIKEKSFLINSAIGLEYKTRRNNIFLFEYAYYKGFATAASFNFATDTYPDGNNPSQHLTASSKTKGDYAEFRFGYRMPFQNFANLYSAIKKPKSKPEPEPEYLKEYRFMGKYWGLETGKQTTFSDQTQQWPDRTDKMQPSFWTPYLAFNAGYQFKNGFITEGGIRLGAGGVQQSGENIFGINAGAGFLLLTTHASVKYAVPLMRDKLFLTPETGLWLSYSSSGEWERISPPNASGPFTNIITRTKVMGLDPFTGYHAGLSLNGRFGKNIELGFGYRYADSFSKKAIAEIETTYDYRNVTQPSILSTTRLKNDAFTISFRKFLRK